MGVRRHRREDNPDWEHIKAQVEDALAECMGIQTITYGKETR
jgi:hypothetical protein